MTPEHGLPLCVDEDRDERWRGDPDDYLPERWEIADEFDPIEEVDA